MTKVRPFTRMVVFGIWTSSGSSVNKSKRGDPQGVPLPPICCASRWHEDVVLLEGDEGTCWGLCRTMPHVSTG